MDKNNKKTIWKKFSEFMTAEIKFLPVEKKTYEQSKSQSTSNKYKLPRDLNKKMFSLDLEKKKSSTTFKRKIKSNIIHPSTKVELSKPKDRTNKVEILNDEIIKEKPQNYSNLMNQTNNNTKKTIYKRSNKNSKVIKKI